MSLQHGHDSLNLCSVAQVFHLPSLCCDNLSWLCAVHASKSPKTTSSKTTSPITTSLKTTSPTITSPTKTTDITSSTSSLSATTTTNTVTSTSPKSTISSSSTTSATSLTSPLTSNSITSIQSVNSTDTNAPASRLGGSLSKVFSTSSSLNSSRQFIPLPTSITSATSTGINSASPSSTERHVGAIVGGIIGGISALTLIMALFWVCRGRRVRLNLAKRLDFLHTAKPKALSNTITFEKEDWLVQVDGAMAAAARQTERARSRTESNQKGLGGSNDYYYSDGYQSPDLMEAKAQQADFRNAAMMTSTSLHADEEWESHDPIYGGGYSTLASETGEGSDLEPGGGPWGHPHSLDDFERRSNASSIPDINEMDKEALEKHRDIMLEKMCKLLDEEPQGPGFVVL
ncbi:hypothetical protein D9615_002028 [Tricholomella constricta]|uniref:Uncharacterized protein n=1 Tax=Tricholomella constricta TaxID=117010 RepID=A0A8H5HPP8_9AGAR|nr:hypothetical protein D9615_002028 [Tricholomella constricta]